MLKSSGTFSEAHLEVWKDQFTSQAHALFVSIASNLLNSFIPIGPAFPTAV